jgi:hypothetical protein
VNSIDRDAAGQGDDVTEHAYRRAKQPLTAEGVDVR